MESFNVACDFVFALLILLYQVACRSEMIRCQQKCMDLEAEISKVRLFHLPRVSVACSRMHRHALLAVM